MQEREALSTQLAAAQERIAELQSELERLSSRDRLSQRLLSLPTFRSHLELDVARARRHNRPLAVLTLDVDGFRSINSHHGYECGDAVLAAVGKLLITHTRGHDLACRMSGDEFAVILHETPLAGALPAAERLLKDLEELVVGPVQGLSASIGAAGLDSEQSGDEVLTAAGAALDRARAAGGGQAVLHSTGNAATQEEPAHGDVVAALVSALEERDRYTGEHSLSLVDMVARVGQELALSPAEVDDVRTAAILHDIGKIGIPDTILRKPGPLDEREWEIMREHPLIGERIIRAIPGMGRIARIVRHEHERWDGQGYPDGIAGEAIPIGSRIILACDAYHAMVSDRPYREAMSHVDAVGELHRHAGSQFDIAVVEALVGYLYGRRQSGVLTL